VIRATAKKPLAALREQRASKTTERDPHDHLPKLGFGDEALGCVIECGSRPREGLQFACSHADLRMENTREANHARKMEAEANRFAARLLMPPARIRANIRSRQPDLAEVVRLSGQFDVSKAAMARSYINAHRETLALLVVRDSRIEQAYRPDDFP
jgi:hypothetical protein